MKKLHILTLMITEDDNPLKWTDLSSITNNHTVVGYLLKNKGKVLPYATLNLYLLNSTVISEPNKEISLEDLRTYYLQWKDSLEEDPKSFMFRNPPLEEWLYTKENWVKKIAYKLSQSYNQSYDECLSSLYMTILKCYKKNNIYIGNLHYIIVAVNNFMRVEHRYMRNRLHGGHPDAIHLDAVPSDFNEGLNDSIASLHEIIGGPTFADLEEEHYKKILEELMTDLKEQFSPREIDQIVNTPGFLPMPLYRRLLKWRKSHRLEDYL